MGGALWPSVALEWNCCPQATALCAGRWWSISWESSQAWWASAVQRPLTGINSSVLGEALRESRAILLIAVDLTRPVCMLHFRRKTVLTSSLKASLVHGRVLGCCFPSRLKKGFCVLKR